ncbi:MAG: hypothetical protein MASP_01023 [Candidatus Methanolliviera sp. GoM_asphalt]|nr:MAG: hypothetical protein MASP_01023 [Candidatus Methanolliviera sp. GoM_asphalt]
MSSVMTQGQVGNAKGGENQREDEKTGFTLSDKERAYYISALQVSKGIVKDARLPVSDVLVGEVFRKTAQNLFWVRTEGIQEQQRQEKRRAKVQEKEEIKPYVVEMPEEERRRIEKAGTDAGLQVRREKAERCKSGEHYEEDEEISDYKEAPTLNDLIGKTIKVLDIQEMASQYDEGRSVEVEGVGWVATYSKILGGQIQHLKDGGKLPAVGKVEKRQSKNGRSYFNFSSSSFSAVKNIRSELSARTLADEEAEIKEFMDY